MEDNYREVKKAEPCLKLIHMDQVEVEEIEWLFYPFIPYGKVTIIQGDPGEGKTTVVLQIIAKLTKGEAILSETSEGKSEETGVEPINVIYQTAEDGLGDTIKPRLLAAGADCSRVLVIDDQDQPLTMVDARLEEAIIQTKARLAYVMWISFPPGRKKRVKRTLPDLLDFEITHKTRLPFCQKDWKKPEHLMPDVRM